MLTKVFLIAACIAAPSVAAQPFAGEPPSESSTTSSAVHAALDGAFESVVHHGEVVLLWDALSEATSYVIEASRPGAPLAEVLRVAPDATYDGVGYSTKLDLPEGRWTVRLIAAGADAATTVRILDVEAPDAFDLDHESADAFYASND